MKSGKSTDSLKHLGKSYRFFAEIRRDPSARRAWRETRLAATSTHKNTHQQADDLLAGTFLTH